LRNREFSAAPAGAFIFLTTNPQLKLRAILFRACGNKHITIRAVHFSIAGHAAKI
jgi:hypothetical protein